MFAWIRGDDLHWTGADTYTAAICVFLLLNGALIFIRRRGLCYHLGLVLTALDAVQMALLKMFIPMCRLWWGEFIEQYKSMLPEIEKDN